MGIPKCVKPCSSCGGAGAFAQGGRRGRGVEQHWADHCAGGGLDGGRRGRIWTVTAIAGAEGGEKKAVEMETV